MIPTLALSSVQVLQISVITWILIPRDIHGIRPYPSVRRKHSTGNSSHPEAGPPLFIAHRGAAFLIPEHTIPAYEVAMLSDVDFVEPDLVMTKDGVFVCHHDITLNASTDVASHSEFSSLLTVNRTLFLDGENVTIVDDWLISDFTWAELSILKVYQERTGWRPQEFSGHYGIPTFQMYVDAVHKDTFRRRQSGVGAGNGSDFVMGMIPELKHPSYHNDFVFRSPHRMERDFVEVLRSIGYLDNNCSYNGSKIPCSPLVIQCFQVDTISYLSERTNLTLLTLLDTQNLRYLTYDGLRELANKTEYVSVWKEMLYTGTEREVDYRNVTYDKEEVKELGGFVGPKELVKYVHGLGMKVGIYTIYHSEEESLRGCAIECERNVTKETELGYYFDMGVDALFVEGLSECMLIRDRWWSGRGEGVGGNNNGTNDKEEVTGESLAALVTEQ